MGATEELQARFDAALMPTYGTPPIALARGEGRYVWDVDGRRYLDLIAGIAVSALGHGHPALTEAVSAQVARLAHTSNLFLHEGEVELAERLIGLLGGAGEGARVFFTNSGTEANEAALKLVKRAAGPGRDHIVAAASGFHGRSLGALALTGKAAIREPFGPFGLDVRFVPYGDAAALREAVTDSCIAVFVEPTQGEAGVVVPPRDYLRDVRAACDAAGAALVLDEIQSGVGRTGHWFAHQGAGVVPDVLTLAKGLGGGLPIGACVGFGDHATAFAKGDHGSTFGGNPVAVAAALAVLDTIESEKLLANAVELGELLAERVRAIGHPLVAEVRGAGLWRAIRLSQQAAAEVQARAAAHGLLVNAVAPDVIRIAPPLTITRAEIEEFTGALPAVLDEAAAGREASG
ncbi:acetylornithine aminotransferase [Spinactinospora alkalitolerans]|uniref:Acetylornithine aminotransferase n=1 Tax=Spinactinospora alkalitolerans TaxID=687207 RepID=A0A852TSG5_9ACTN|nr:acetylornithine transaminase [Spinactinospora alkalitolerans]NYE46561.1 acetylornithine aminotransferase [Spinactinospora alkalitolerans]